MTNHEVVCQELASHDNFTTFPDRSTEIGARRLRPVIGSYFYVTENEDVTGSPWRFWTVSREGVKEFTP